MKIMQNLCDLISDKLESVDLDSNRIIKNRVGMKGPSNPNWNGGSSEYPNHAEFKRVRLQVLIEEHFTCHYCGKATNQVHHKDLSKDNHKRENLTACCQSCNLKRGTSKYKRLYGKTAKELGNQLNCSQAKIYYLHKDGKLIKDGKLVKNEKLTKSCNMKRATSKFRRLYGKTIKELSDQLFCSQIRVYHLHKNGKLAGLLSSKGEALS